MFVLSVARCPRNTYRHECTYDVAAKILENNHLL